MPDFLYTARDRSGQKVSGSVSAASRREAVAAITGQALFPVEVRAKDAELARGKSVRRVPAQRLAVFYSQLADLLRNGVPLLKSLDVLRKQSGHAGLSAVLSDVHHQVEDGATLADAMARHRRVFGEMAVSMVRAGGEGGFLEEVLARIAEFTETQEDLKKRTLGAVAYPAFLAVVGTIVVAVLIIFFVPRFEELFQQLRERNELPWMTDALLSLSHFLGRWGWVMLAVAAPAIFFAARWLRSESGTYFWHRWKIRLPLGGAIFLELAVARFCRVLGTLLHNGVPILRALDISSGATANRVLARAIQQATEHISAGQSLAGPLGACGHFPATVVEMIAVAEQSNSLEPVLLDIAQSMERRTWRRLELAVRLLEPILLLILAAAVLAVVIALLLPVLKMSATI